MDRHVKCTRIHSGSPLWTFRSPLARSLAHQGRAPWKGPLLSAHSYGKIQLYVATATSGRGTRERALQARRAGTAKHATSLQRHALYRILSSFGRLFLFIVYCLCLLCLLAGQGAEEKLRQEVCAGALISSHPHTYVATHTNNVYSSPDVAGAGALGSNHPSAPPYNHRVADRPPPARPRQVERRPRARRVAEQSLRELVWVRRLW